MDSPDETIDLTKPFVPSKHLTRVSGNPYLEVKWRIAWVRSVYPDCSMKTEMIQDDGERAVFFATVTLPTGGSATGWGQEQAMHFGDYLEKAECLTLDAEILTRMGFRRYDQVAVGDEVAAYDLVADRLVWTPLRQVVTYDDAQVAAFGGKWFQAVGTSDHSWAIADDVGRRSLVPAGEIKTHHRLILAAPGPDETGPLTPDEAAVLGWLVTDGTIWDAGGFDPKIYQSKPAQIETIRTLVLDQPGAMSREWVGLPTTRTFPKGNTSQCLPQHVFHLRHFYVRRLLERAGIDSYAELPALATRLSAAARGTMLTAIMAADGDAKGYFGKKRKPGVQECWQILATLQGHAVGATRNAATFAVQRLKARRYASGSEFHLVRLGRQPVWCPTTDYGTWVTRLGNGQITITGNTKALGRALAALGFGAQFCDDHQGGAGDEKRGQPVAGRQRDQGQRRAALSETPVRQAARAGQAQAATNGQATAGDREAEATTQQLEAIHRLAAKRGMSQADLDGLAQTNLGAPVSQINYQGARRMIRDLQAIKASAIPNA